MSASKPGGFMVIPGIVGEASHAQYKGAIVIENVSTANQNSDITSGMGGSRIPANEIHVTRRVNGVSKHLLQFCLVGKHADISITVFSYNRAGALVARVNFNLHDASIGGYRVGGKGEMEFLTIRFLKSNVQHLLLDAEGKNAML